MRVTLLLLVALAMPFSISSQEVSSSIQPTLSKFPQPSFVLHDAKRKSLQSGVVFGPMKNDGKGGTAGSFAFYGGDNLVQIMSLAFSGDGKILAVGSTPSLVDIWNVDTKQKIRSFMGGTTVAVSADGRKVAKDGDGLQVLDISSGKLEIKIPWKGSTVQRLSFDPQGKKLLVSANGENDKVFDIWDGHLLAELQNTQQSCFSKDGEFVIGGNTKHLITWNTRTWTKLKDLPNGPDYVVTVAVNVNKDLIVIGGPSTARLLRLSTGEEVSKAGLGYINFAALNQDGTLILDYSSTGFGVWNMHEIPYCLEPNLKSNEPRLVQMING